MAKYVLNKAQLTWHSIGASAADKEALREYVVETEVLRALTGNRSAKKRGVQRQNSI